MMEEEERWGRRTKRQRELKKKKKRGGSRRERWFYRRRRLGTLVGKRGRQIAKGGEGAGGEVKAVEGGGTLVEGDGGEARDKMFGCLIRTAKAGRTMPSMSICRYEEVDGTFRKGRRMKI